MVRVFQVEPDLLRLVDRDLAATARRHIVAQIVSVEQGRWPAALLEANAPPLGALLLDGLLAKVVLIGGRRGIELVGPGDVIHPWKHDGHRAMVPMEETWKAMAPTRLALLDEEFLRAVSRLPGVLPELMQRANSSSRSLAMQRALTQIRPLSRRLLVYLWYLAHRWGRVSSEGVVLTIRLSHGTLADLVSASRPPVSVALGELTSRGLISQRGRGWWMLHGAAPEELCAVLGRGHDSTLASVPEVL